MSKRRLSILMVVLLILTMNLGLSAGDEQTVPPQVNVPKPPSYEGLPDFPVESETETEAETQPPATNPPAESPSVTPTSGGTPEKEAIETVGKTLETLKTLTGEDRESAILELETVVKSAVEATSRVQVKQMANGVLTVSKDALLEKANAVNALSDELSALSQGFLSKPIEKKVRIAVETDDTNTLELDLPELESVFEIVDVIEIETSMGSVAIGKNIFASGEVPSKVAIKEVPKASLPPELQNVKVISFEIFRASETESDFQKPVVVSVPFAPETSGDEAFLTAFYLDENGVSTPVPGYFENGIFIFKTNHFSKFYIGMNKVTFEDVKVGWAKPYIQDMAAKGVVKGKSVTTFDPEADVTRAEFITLISRVLNYGKSQTQLPYADVVLTDWYYAPTQMLYDAGIIEASEMLDPNGHMTREEMGVLLGKTLEELGYSKAQAELLERFSDMGTLSQTKAVHIATAVQNKVLEGFDGKFNPNDNMTREEAVAVIYRLLRK